MASSPSLNLPSTALPPNLLIPASATTPPPPPHTTPGSNMTSTSVHHSPPISQPLSNSPILASEFSSPSPSSSPHLAFSPTEPSLPHSSLPQPALVPPPLRTHPMTTRLQAGITKPKQQFSLHSSLTTETEPNTYLQAVSQPQWRTAMSNEFLALQQQGTWTLVPPPPDSNIIGCRWIFRIKRPADGSPSHYKARLVAQGFTQEFGTDF